MWLFEILYQGTVFNSKMKSYRSSDPIDLKIHVVIIQTDSFRLKKEPSDSDYGAPRNTNLKLWFVQLKWSKNS